jgi:FtsP/CotA-like multicopper oxidase with cupredoxin domain
MYQDKLPGLNDLTVLNNPSSLTIQIEPRQARLSDAVTPAAINAWCYVNVPEPQHVGSQIRGNYLGPVINVLKGKPLKVVWINKLSGMPPMKPEDGPTQEMPPIDPLPMDLANPMWKAMNPSIGIVTHLHGLKVEPSSDGWPLEPAGFVGSQSTYGFPTSRTYHYPNDQRAAMLWFHDHGMDNTAVQVHAGLAGLYFIRDESDEDIFRLIGGPKEEIPLVIQDRNVTCGFESFDYWAGTPTTADGADFIRPEFLGETIFVNGRPSPFVNVQRQIYRLRILNGSNARSYALALIDPSGWTAQKQQVSMRVWYSDLLTVIGNDGGLVSKSQSLPSTGYILLAPGERLDLLLDLTSLDLQVVSQLRLVNLALNSLRNGSFPEAIFQTEAFAQSSILPTPVDENDTALLSILGASQANILQFCIGPHKARAGVDKAKLDQILAEHSKDEAFQWNGAALESIPPNARIACNRLVLLMNDTTGQAPAISPSTGSQWKDTQIWEMAPASGPNSFNVPFDVDLAASNPAPGAPTPPGAGKGYSVARWSFFTTYPPSRLVDKAPDFKYADLHEAVFKPAAGTYERWYVANIGNAQPTRAVETDGTIPDMHPFHLHLVNFVVQGRWRLDPETNVFVGITGDRPLDFDRVARHDTVRVEANELLELLVYFPRGYKGKYPYHCHIVEHEDMGMMSHFEVV